MDVGKFTLELNDHVAAVPCLELVAFSFGAPAEGAGFARFLRVFHDAFGDRLRVYRMGDMKRFRPFDDQALEGPRHWFSKPDLMATKMLGFVAHAGATAHDIATPGLHISLMGLHKPQRYVFRMVLPVEMDNSPDKVVRMAQDALADFPLASGYCGYSLLWDRDVDAKVCEWAAPLLRRHPGLGYGKPIAITNASQMGLAVVSWLTLLGPDLTAALGGRDALARSAPAEVSVLPLGKDGVILRAGAAPALGDVNRQDFLPAYQAVGRLVAPVVAPDEALDEVAVDGMKSEHRHEWLRRFFV
jgi:hypothetical protein